MIELLIYEIGLVIVFLCLHLFNKSSLRDPLSELELESYQSIIFLSVFWPYLIPLSFFGLVIILFMRFKNEEVDKS